jgi:hypothetical protein
VAVSTVHGDLPWVDGASLAGSRHEQELLALSGLDRVLDVTEVASLLDRGFWGMAKGRQSHAQRACNRVQAGLRAPVEQSIGHLANAWALRRWRGLLYRVRDVFQATVALVCLGRWLHRVPMWSSITDTLTERRLGWHWEVPGCAVRISWGGHHRWRILVGRSGTRRTR